MKARLIGFFGLAVFVLSFAVILSSCNKSSDPNAQLNKEISDINTYMSTNFLAYDNVLALNNGVAIGLTQTGQGAIPRTGQTVFITYTVSLFSDGTIIKKDSIQDQVIDNISETGLQAIEFIPEGSHAQIFVPSSYAYGSQGDATLNVPPNATLIYDIYLKRITITSAQAIQFELDEQRIERYLDSLHITATKLPTGVWMQTNSIGTGDNPKIYDYVSFHYKGTILSSGTLFQESDATSTPLLQLIEGLQQGMPQMEDGGIATFYIPSLYGYGLNKDGSGNIINVGIPPNAPLIFQITLNGINQ